MTTKQTGIDPQARSHARVRRFRVPVTAAIVAAAGGLAVAVVPAGAAAAPACAATPSPSAEAALTAMINQTRRSQGVVKVARDTVLQSAGRRWSVSMANGAPFAHPANGRLPFARGGSAGQNIAMASGVGEAYQALLASPGHRKNILGRTWRHTGVGAAVRCDGMLFVTMNFSVAALA